MSDAPAPADLSVTLSPLEVSVLRALRAAGASSGACPEPEVVRASGESVDGVRGSLERLRSKRLVVLEETSHETLSLTGRGKEALAKGLPERLLARALASGPRPKSELLSEGFTEEELAAGVGRLRRLGLATPGAAISLTGTVPDELPEEVGLREVQERRPVANPETLKGLLNRGLVAKEVRRDRAWRLSPEGSSLPLPAAGTETLGPLTPARLRDGSWAKANFRPYDVRAEVPHVEGARLHPYREWLRRVEEVLVGMGFEEFRSPIVELEFYNNDLLFMPQEHPARSMHDMFFLEGVEGKGPPARLLKAVAGVHEGRAPPRQKVPLSAGWQTPYREEVARRVILRSQTTAASTRYLATHPKPPFRMYCLDAVFRYDALDATHLIQFDQCEGVVGKRGLTFRHLLGLLSEFAKALGIRDVRFQPTYFPFTEPSVQGFVKHPKLGWVEMMPGGMLRPEVLRPLGIRVPVAAWGLGIGRLAMVALGLSDIRDLFLDDLSRLSSSRI